jgi:mono/diheme cytochrome c family protein
VRAGAARWSVPLAFAVFLGPIDTLASAQDGSRVEPHSNGRNLYLNSCSNCHGADGTGSAANWVGLPIVPPDFTDSRFASREPAADWAGIATLGGPIRGFDRLMPAFGDALNREEIDLVLEHVQTLYPDKNWPRGEFNLPLPLVTEKAFPEDETVFKNTVGTGDAAGSVMNKLIYEKRFGSRSQLEVVVPFGWRELSDAYGPNGEWVGGVGDLAVGLKRVLIHDLGVGSIVSLTFETIVPTGNEDKGFGKGFTVFEPFLTYGQLLPLDAFYQIQTGVELPTNQDEAENEGLFRLAVGKTFRVGGEWGRAFSPMVEFLGAKELEGGTAVWDIVPEMQVTLNQRQHIMVNFGVRLPLTETEGRDAELLSYILWDWFDGGFFEGW